MFRCRTLADGNLPGLIVSWLHGFPLLHGFPFTSLCSLLSDGSPVWLPCIDLYICPPDQPGTVGVDREDLGVIGRVVDALWDGYPALKGDLGVDLRNIRRRRCFAVSTNVGKKAT
jgi:hypothetical protein